MHRLLTLLAAFLLAPVPARGAEQSAPKKPMTAELMWQLARLGPPSISPDGKWAVLAVTNYDVKTDKPSSALWLLPSGGGAARQLTPGTRSASNPPPSPDRPRIAFTRH